MPRVAADPPSPPRLPEQLEPAAIASAGCADGATEIQLAEEEFSGRSAARVRLDAVRLTRLDLSGSRFPDLRIVDAELSDCDLANVYGRGAVVSRVAIVRSRLTGIAVGEAALGDLSVRDCRVDLASFGACRLARVRFESCQLHDATFIEAELDSVRFDDCDLSRADFRGARLRRCEFRRCDLTGIEGVASLRGGAIDLPSIVGLARVWASALGIGVLDDEPPTGDAP